MIARDHQIERFGDTERACDFQRGAGFRDVSDDAINDAAAEFDGARFQHPVP